MGPRRKTTLRVTSERVSLLSRPAAWERELLAPLAQRFLRALLDDDELCDKDREDGERQTTEE
jgi:hypothetical protein